MTYDFKRWYWRETQTYGVFVNDVCLGCVVATTKSRYPGRSKASYFAFPAISDGGIALMPLGTFNSRREASDAIVARLRETKHGNARLARAERS